MADYVDGYVFPVSRDRLEAYQRLASTIAELWIEHGATAYREYVGPDQEIEGTLPFAPLLGCTDDEVVVFGWMCFPSREARDAAHEALAADPRVEALMADADVGFDASRMVYGGFRPLVEA